MNYYLFNKQNQLKLIHSLQILKGWEKNIVPIGSILAILALILTSSAWYLLPMGMQISNSNVKENLQHWFRPLQNRYHWNQFATGQ